MKSVKISKKMWRQLRQLKNQWDLTTIPKTIEHLLDSQPSLHLENLQEIHLHVDRLKNAKNLEEKIAKKQSSVIELQCMQCGSTPFKLDESVCDEAGIICPFCGWFHGIIIDEGGDKNETL